MLVLKGKTSPESKRMKRLGNIYDEIISLENLRLADKKASKGKKKQYGVIAHNKNKEANIQALHDKLKAGEYKNPVYKVFKIYEPKEREVFVIPYTDRIVHHAIMNKLEVMFYRTFTKDTYSCIKKRGIHLGKKNVEKALLDEENTQYCLKIDVRKFYPSVDHDILKMLLMRKIKDKRLLNLLFEIIDSAVGLPIGNYLSQTLANFYLCYFAHWLKEEMKVKDLFIYCDDIVIFARDKPRLHLLLFHMRNYLTVNLKLEIKGNYQIFPVGEQRGIDFLGYVYFRDYTKLRKSIKKNFAKMLKYNPNEHSIGSYLGWTKHCSARNLEHKLLTNYEISKNSK